MQQEKFIDIELITPEGERKWLSEYVGHSKFLFIDFWASWCGPCIADIPKIKQVYEKYKDKGLEVLSISMDYSNKSWTIAMDKVDMHGGSLYYRLILKPQNCTLLLVFLMVF